MSAAVLLHGSADIRNDRDDCGQRSSIYGAGVAFVRGILRAFALAICYPCALADAAWLRLVTHPTGSALAHARAAWLHRWSRFACRVLGLHIERHGFEPVSGIVVANHLSLIDALLLASIRPCVFVARAGIRDLPVVGLIARLAGTVFIERQRRNDIARVNFMIQRAVLRRQLVVILPECGRSEDAAPHVFSSTLLQPAVEIGCSLTAAAIDYRVAGTALHGGAVFAQRTTLPAADWRTRRMRISRVHPSHLPARRPQTARPTASRGGDCA